LNSGPRKHGVVAPSVVAAIEAFFALRDWSGLWLSGGTCLAEYWLGHRVSVDIDLFTGDARLYRDARETLRRPDALGPIGEIETVRVDLRSCQFLLRAAAGGVVKIDLVHDIPVRLGPGTRLGDVWLDSLTDITSNKMGCLVQREDVKDYVDLYFLIPRLGLDARAALDLGLRKEAGLDPLLLAEQLRYVQGRSRPDFLRTDVPWENVLHFFARMREDLLRLVAPDEP
jgi:hypothetical protein